MKRRITSISVKQTGKVIGILYGMMTLPVAPIGFIVVGVGTGHYVQGALFVIFPFVYGGLGYLVGMAMASTYNWVAQRFGGIEVTVE